MSRGTRLRSLPVVLAALGLVFAACANDDRLPTEVGVDLPLAGGPSWSQMPDEELESWVEQANYRVIVGFKNVGDARGVSPRGERLLSAPAARDYQTQLELQGLRFQHQYELIPAAVAEIPAGLVSQIRHLPFIDYVEPIIPGRRLGGIPSVFGSRSPAVPPADATLMAQTTPWNLTKVLTEQAWQYTQGSGVRILIIDSGRDQNHPELQGVSTYRCGGDGSWDSNGHGTFVLGVIAAANNSEGVIGGAYGAQVFMVKDGDAEPDPSQTACGVEWARQNDIFVINISTGYAVPTQALTDQINAAFNEGRLIVAASGNQNTVVSYPANLANVIAVGATTATDQRFSGSNFGSTLDLVAPGVDVYSTARQANPTPGTTCNAPSGYSTCTGTSFAAPHVAFAAALVRSQNPTFTNVQVRQRLRETAVDLGAPGFDIYYGYGRLNVGAALGNGGSTPILSVAINGPVCVYQPGLTTYSAATTGGTAPFQYSWYRDVAPYEGNWEFLGFGSPRSISWVGGAYSARVKVRVTDAAGNIREPITTVQVLTSGGAAPPFSASTTDGGGDREAKSCAGGGGPL